MDPLAERLRKERVARGLTTAELSNLTKVREPYIDALERGMYNILPAVYVRSFIKTLGNALRIPPHEIQQLIAKVLDDESNKDSLRYQADAPQKSHLSASETLEKTSDTVSNLVANLADVAKQLARITLRSFTSDKKYWAFGITAAAILTVAIIVLFTGDDGPARDGSGTDTVEIGPEDSIRLLAIADDTSQFTITIDNQRNEKVLLLPNNEYSWGAMDRFVINNVFNAGAIKFSRNGEPFRQFGKANEVLRELTITRQDFVASNSPARANPAVVKQPTSPRPAATKSPADNPKPKSPDTGKAKTKAKTKAKDRGKAKGKAKGKADTKTAKAKAPAVPVKKDPEEKAPAKPD